MTIQNLWPLDDGGDMDFETYSEAGCVWVEEGQKWVGPPGSEKSKGISAVGAAAYAEHWSTEVLTFSYRIPGDRTTYRWKPGQPNPQRLFDYLAAGGAMYCHNAMFERLIWHYVCERIYGWPELPFYALRCTAARARVLGLPGALGKLSDVLKLPTPKDQEGVRLINKFSIPQKPTKKNPVKRILPEDDPVDFAKLENYCDTDLDAEEGVRQYTKPMSNDELRFWHIDQEINWRGIGVNRPAIQDMIIVLDAAFARYGEEFQQITGFNHTQTEKAKGWLHAMGIPVSSLDAEAKERLLKRDDIQGSARRVIEIMDLIGSASVKKLYAMDRYANSDDRLRNLIIHHGARTGRPTGEGPQPLNMPKDGPDLAWCDKCHHCQKPGETMCFWCFGDMTGAKKRKWAFEYRFPDGHVSCAVEDVLFVMSSRNLDLVEMYFGDALLCISGCLRSMFVAQAGYDLIASDYSAIEAVVIAMLSGEQWRIDAFRQKVDIYLASCSKVTGRTLEEYQQYQLENDAKHPDRQEIGKPAELGLGFGGWIGAWRVFDSSERFSDEEVKDIIKAWRRESPAIVEMWGGQFRGMPWEEWSYPELYGVEGCFISAVQNPDAVYDYRGIKFFMDGTDLKIRLLSGRELTYASPVLIPWQEGDRGRRGSLKIFYWTWNSNPKMGPLGWVLMETFGGRLVENIVQATAHDILRYAIENLRLAGYATVLHVYDEIVVEVPEGLGTIEEMERIMATMPEWAKDWPIRATDGWRGKLYRKG